MAPLSYGLLYRVQNLEKERRDAVEEKNKLLAELRQKKGLQAELQKKDDELKEAVKQWDDAQKYASLQLTQKNIMDQ